MPTPPTIGGYTPQSMAQEVTHRAMAQLQLEARTKGTKLSKRDRELAQAAATIGAIHMFKLFGEIAREQARHDTK